MKKVFLIFITPLTALLVGSAFGASFDCKKASTDVEKLICNTPELSRADEVLADNYGSIQTGNIGDGARTQLKADQVAWLKARNVCKDRDCILDSYLKRSDQVCDIPVISGAHPLCKSADQMRDELGLSSKKPIKSDIQKLPTTPISTATQSIEIKGVRIGMSTGDVFKALGSNAYVVNNKYKFSADGLTMYYCKENCKFSIAEMGVYESTLIFNKTNNLLAANFFTYPETSQVTDLINVLKQKYGQPDYKKSRAYGEVVAQNPRLPAAGIERVWASNVATNYYGEGTPFVDMWVGGDGAIILAGLSGDVIRIKGRLPVNKGVTPYENSKGATQYETGKRITLTSEAYAALIESIKDVKIRQANDVIEKTNKDAIKSKIKDL